MNLRFLIVSVTAFLAGLAGGWTSRFLPTDLSTSRYGTIRATRIELVDKTGNAKAFIGTDSDRDTALVFLDDKGRERAKFGLVYGPFAPMMVMYGGDGKERVVFQLSMIDDRPMIFLGDQTGVRAHLGSYQNDAPDPKDENWGLWFYPPHNPERSLAGVGIRRDYTDDKIKGYVFPTVDQKPN